MDAYYEVELHQGELHALTEKDLARQCTSPFEIEPAVARALGIDRSQIAEITYRPARVYPSDFTDNKQWIALVTPSPNRVQERIEERVEDPDFSIAIDRLRGELAFLPDTPAAREAVLVVAEAIASRRAWERFETIVIDRFLSGKWNTSQEIDIDFTRLQPK